MKLSYVSTTDSDSIM